MKKIIGWILILTAFTLTIMSFTNKESIHNIDFKDKNIKSQILYKGLKESRDFTVDEYGNYFIAFKDRIQFINKDGKSYDLLLNKNFDIYSVEYYNGNLYYASNTIVNCYNLKTKKNTTLIKDLPNYGDYKKSIIRIRGDYVYVTIGAATNSGVVGPDNKWIEEFPYSHDISPKTITIKGINFGAEKTGAFSAYKTKNIKGQIVTDHFPGNSSIIIYNLKTLAMENYAWGIRNFKGMDFNSAGNLFITVGGMEDRGLRPVKGDSDYIYEIKKGEWYGFPDYTGGDPVNSPKFKGLKNKTIAFILDKHPSNDPKAPIYQHEKLSALGPLAIDNKKVLGEEDCIYFYESKDNIIYTLTKQKNVKEQMQLPKKSNIVSMKFIDSKLAMLDDNSGYLYNIELNNDKENKFSKNVFYYLIVMSVILIISILAIFIKKD